MKKKMMVILLLLGPSSSPSAKKPINVLEDVLEHQGHHMKEAIEKEHL